MRALDGRLPTGDRTARATQPTGRARLKARKQKRQQIPRRPPPEGAGKQVARPQKDKAQSAAAILTRFLAYGEKVFGLRAMWRQRVRDSRPQPEIPTEVFPAAFFAMFACRLPSFNELEQQRRSSCWKRWLGGRALPMRRRVGLRLGKDRPGRAARTATAKSTPGSSATRSSAHATAGCWPPSTAMRSIPATSAAAEMPPAHRHRRRRRR